MYLLLPHFTFTFKLIIRFFLMRFRYTGTIISSDATVLEAYSSASASAESLTDVLFLLIRDYLIRSDQFSPQYSCQSSVAIPHWGLSTQLLSAKLQLLERPLVALRHTLTSGGHVCFREEEAFRTTLPNYAMREEKWDYTTARIAFGDRWRSLWGWLSYRWWSLPTFWNRIRADSFAELTEYISC